MRGYSLKQVSTRYIQPHITIFSTVPWILRKREVVDYFTYKWKVNGREHINPQDYGLSRTKFRHLKVLDLLDEDGVKPLETLKDKLGLLKVHYS